VSEASETDDRVDVPPATTVAAFPAGAPGTTYVACPELADEIDGAPREFWYRKRLTVAEASGLKNLAAAGDRNEIDAAAYVLAYFMLDANGKRIWPNPALQYEEIRATWWADVVVDTADALAPLFEFFEERKEKKP